MSAQQDYCLCLICCLLECSANPQLHLATCHINLVREKSFSLIDLEHISAQYFQTISIVPHEYLYDVDIS